MDQVVEALEVELPDAMVDYRAEQMVQDYAQRITSQGIPFEKYLEMTGQTMDRMKEQAKESAIKQIKYEMAMDAVAAAEDVYKRQPPLSTRSTSSTPAFWPWSGPSRPWTPRRILP